MVDSRQMYHQGSVERRKMNIVETLSEQLSEIGYPERRVRTGQVRANSAGGFRSLDSKQTSLLSSVKHCWQSVIGHKALLRLIGPEVSVF